MLDLPLSDPQPNAALVDLVYPETEVEKFCMLCSHDLNSDCEDTDLDLHCFSYESIGFIKSYLLSALIRLTVVYIFRFK